MSKPKYRAYKPVDMTDGLQNWNQHTFDNTVVWTTDDEKMFVDVSMSLAPNTRITSMQARLNSLKNITPAIKLHADAIRTIHDELDNHFSINHEGMIALQRADDLWTKIMVLRDLLPKAIMGAKSSKAQSDRAKIPRKLTEDEEKRIVHTYEKAKDEGSVYGVVKMLSNSYNVGQKTINNVVNKSRNKK